MLRSRSTILVFGALVATGVALVAASHRPVAPISPPTPTAVVGLPKVLVYKSPSCGCCKKWVEHMKTAGFPVEVKDLEDVGPIKAELGVPAALVSCHTAVVGGYLLEGHVPADLVVNLLRDHPKVSGLAVPGMVTGSPGMEGDHQDRYDVIAFDAKGGTSVYAKR